MLPEISWLTSPFLLVFTICFLLYKYSTRKLSYWTKVGIPGPKPLPFIGNLWKVITFQSSIGPLLKELYDSEEAPLMGIFVFDDPVLLVRSPEIVKQILAKNFQNFQDRLAASPEHNQIFRNLLFMQKNPEWRQLRVKLSPVFTATKIKILFGVVKDVADSLTSYLGEHSGIQDGKQISYDYTTEIVSQSFFGMKANCFGNENSVVRQKSRELFNNTLRNTFSQTLYFFKPRLAELFHLNFFSSIVQDFFVQTFWKCVAENEKGNLSSSTFIAFLNEIRKNDPTFDGNVMAAQGISFFAAGTETSSTTLAFTLYEMCMNPEVQTKLRQEIESELEHEEITYEKLKELKYLHVCILESLRKYPALSIVERRCNADYAIPDTSVVIKRGTPVFISLLGIQNDPKYFPNPEKYYPERFFEDPESSNLVMSFGYGPRNCIGERFAILSVKLAIVQVLRNFKIISTPDTPKKIEYSVKSVALESETPLLMKFIPLNSEISS